MFRKKTLLAPIAEVPSALWAMPLAILALLCIVIDQMVNLPANRSLTKSADGVRICASKQPREAAKEGLVVGPIIFTSGNTLKNPVPKSHLLLDLAGERRMGSMWKMIMLVLLISVSVSGHDEREDALAERRAAWEKCDRSRSRLARSILNEEVYPMVEKKGFSFPSTCPWSKQEDMYLDNELVVISLPSQNPLKAAEFMHKICAP
jgi:hypothetical protein